MGLCCSRSQQFSVQEHVVQLKNLKEATVYNCKVRLMCGSILVEDTDAIMTQCDLKYPLSSPLTNQIRRMGGNQIFQELQQTLMQEDELDYGDVVYTHAGDLDFEYIFFGILPYFMKNNLKKFENFVGKSSAEKNMSSVHKCQKQYIYHCISNVLRKAEDLCLESVSLPVLGQDLSKFTIGVTAMIMLLAIKMFLEENQNTLQYLKMISISVEAQDEIDAFTWHFKSIMEQKEGQPKHKNMKLLSMASNFDQTSPMAFMNEQSIEQEQTQFGHSYTDNVKNHRKESM